MGRCLVPDVTNDGLGQRVPPSSRELMPVVCTSLCAQHMSPLFALLKAVCDPHQLTHFSNFTFGFHKKHIGQKEAVNRCSVKLQFRVSYEIEADMFLMGEKK